MSMTFQPTSRSSDKGQALHFPYYHREAYILSLLNTTERQIGFI